jgi:hypothetical protein
MSDILEYSGVSLFFADRRLDSRDPNFRVLFVSYGQQDEQSSRGTGEKVPMSLDSILVIGISDSSQCG